MSETRKKPAIWRQPWVMSLAGMVVVFGTLGIFIFWQSSSGVVYTDKAYLDAPIADIAPTSGGGLNALYVKEDDRITENEPVAVVGSETLYAKEAGIVSAAPQVLGSYYAPGQTVVSVVADQKMRVVSQIDENGGLDRIRAGERVRFTVDAFPGRTYEGVVDEVSPASDTVGIAFSISDKRATRQFDVYTRFDPGQYPELKTGMSAKTWIYIQ